ncbi:MAG TPA: transcriptional regulator [Clostridiales bacterium]|nr:MAG: hypothetical protein A2Y18_06135 [Clostridiales bacterium GWD2_32_19]HCC07018.1 transcriptional regulator [Clostridiales bacterium]
MFNPDFSNAIKVIDRSEGKSGTVFEVIEYTKPRAGEQLRQVRIYIKEGSIIMQSGALQFMKGQITMDATVSVATALKGFFTSKGSGESLVTPKYTGKNGEIYLEPTNNYYYVLELQNDEIILDDGLFYCCEDSIALSVHTNTNVLAGLFSGDGFRQPKITGTGVAVLESNVPFEEILIYQLNNETLKVDGNFAMVVRGNIQTKIEKSSKSIIGSARSGEGILQTYTGTGEVWLAPAKNYKPLDTLLLTRSI